MVLIGGGTRTTSDIVKYKFDDLVRSYLIIIIIVLVGLVLACLWK